MKNVQIEYQDQFIVRLLLIVYPFWLTFFLLNILPIENFLTITLVYSFGIISIYSPTIFTFFIRIIKPPIVKESLEIATNLEQLFSKKYKIQLPSEIQNLLDIEIHSYSYFNGMSKIIKKYLPGDHNIRKEITIEFCKKQLYSYIYNLSKYTIRYISDCQTIKDRVHNYKLNDYADMYFCPTKTDEIEIKTDISIFIKLFEFISDVLYEEKDSSKEFRDYLENEKNRIYMQLKNDNIKIN